MVYDAKLQPPYKLANWGNWTVALREWEWLRLRKPLRGRDILDYGDERGRKREGKPFTLRDLLRSN